MQRPKNINASKRRSRVVFLIRLTIGLVILTLLLLLIDVRELVTRLVAVSPVYGAAICAVAVASRILRAFKWNLLLRVHHVYLSWWSVLRVCFIGHFFGAWVPGAIGGEAYRVAALRKLNQTPAVLSSIIVERYIGLLVQTLVVVVMLPWTIPYLLKLSPLVMVAILAFGLLVAVFVPAVLSQSFVRHLGRLAPRWGLGWVRDKAKVIHAALMEYVDQRTTLLIFGILTGVEFFSFLAINYLSARAVGLDVSFVYFMCAMPVVHLLLRIPVSVQALGIQEGAFATALVLHGFSIADGLSISVVQRAAEWLCSILPGAALLFLTHDDALGNMED